MTDLRLQMLVNMGGNLEQGAQRNARAMQRMSEQGRRHLRALRGAAGLADRGLNALGNRYTALITGGGAVAAARGVVALEARLERLGVQAGISSERVREMQAAIYDAAQSPDIRVDPSQILEAIESIVEKTGDLTFAEGNIRNIGLAIRATSSEGGAIGELFGEFQKLGGFDPKGVLKALEVLNEQGKSGAFTLANLAALGPRTITAYARAVKGGRESVQMLTELGTLQQIIRMGVGDPAAAATVVERVLAELQDVQKIRMLQGMGIQVFDPNQPGAEVMRDVNQILLDVLDKTKGRGTIMGRIFGDEAIRAFNALNADRVRQFMSVTGDGNQVIADAARNASTADAALTSLYTAFKRFADSELTAPIQSLADAVNSLDATQLQEMGEKAKQAALLLGGAYVVSKVGKTVARGVGALRGGAGAAGAAGAIAGGVQPVFVVNMPGGMPGIDIGNGRNPGQRPRVAKWKVAAAFLGSSPVSELGMYGAAGVATSAAAVAAAGAAGYAAGTALYDNVLEGTDFADSLGRGIARGLAFFGNDEAKATLESERQRGEVTVRIEAEPGTRVVDTRAKGTYMDLDVARGLRLGAL